MSPSLQHVTQSPLLIRVVPFVIFLVLTFLQGKLGETSKYWLYAAKTFLAVWLILWMRPHVPEMRWKFSWEGLVAGLAVFALWVGLDGLYPAFGSGGEGWNPHQAFGEGTALAWSLIAIRVLGSAWVVSPLEEVFYRSFLYRYIMKPDFQSVPLGQFEVRALLVTSVIFGVVHPGQWLAGILCGLAFQGLVIWRKRLGDAMFAHAITNLLLGIWVAWKGEWQFW